MRTARLALYGGVFLAPLVIPVLEILPDATGRADFVCLNGNV